jgi:hypothetical protein
MTLPELLDRRDNPLSQENQIAQARDILTELFLIPGFSELSEEAQVLVLHHCCHCYTLGVVDGMVSEKRKQITRA